jgi:hypothetical protein
LGERIRVRGKLEARGEWIWLFIHLPLAILRQGGDKSIYKVISRGGPAAVQLPKDSWLLMLKILSQGWLQMSF